MHFGRGASTGVRVVVKQYQANHFTGLSRELRIFTLIERQKMQEEEPSLRQIIMNHENQPDGLPTLLGYTVEEGLGEILLENAGKELNYWQVKLINKDKRMAFVCQMLPQIIEALKTIHDFGYSHGDLKLENICARVTTKGEFKFTLIDFGVSSKLHKVGLVKPTMNFRGNFTFAPTEQITQRRASKLDDLFSLLYVAYKFVYDKLPWEKCLNTSYRDAGSMMSANEFIKLRFSKRNSFENAILESSGELQPLFEYLTRLR